MPCRLNECKQSFWFVLKACSHKLQLYDRMCDCTASCNSSLGGIFANLVMANNNITNPTLTGYTESEVSNTAVTGTYTLNCVASNFWDLTLTGNVTNAMDNCSASSSVWINEFHYDNTGLIKHYNILAAAPLANSGGIIIDITNSPCGS